MCWPSVLWASPAWAVASPTASSGGSVLGGAARFVVHYISGITIYKILAPTEIFGTVFDNPALYSLIYNGSYVGIDLVLCLVIFGILYAPLKTYMTGADLRR